MLDEEGAKREKDPDYKDIEISLWERTAACKRPMIFLPHLIDEAYELDPGFTEVHWQNIIYYQHQVEEYRRN